MKINLITLTILLVATFTAQAQNNDRVITVNNDTIPCKLGGPNMFFTFKYTTTENGPTTKIRKEEIKEFYSADKKIWFRKIFFGNDHILFMRVLERGKISLYETFVNTGNVTSDLWYATKNSDTAVYIKTDALSIFSGTKKGKKVFVNYLADNKPIQDQYIADDNPGIDEIQRLVHWYNTGNARENYSKRSQVDVSGIDYVITKKNDTIHGRIKHDFFKGYFTFTEKNKNDTIKIDSVNIYEFFYSEENSSFLLKTLPEINAKEFVKWLEKGQVNLFEFAKSTGSPDNPVIKYYWYVNKGDGSLIAIKIDANNNYDIRSHKELLAALRNIISDNKDILSNFNYDLNYVNSNTDIIIRSYISNYNKEYSENRPKNK